MENNQRSYHEIKQEIFALVGRQVFGDFANVGKDDLELTELEKEARRRWNTLRRGLVHRIADLDDSNPLPNENSLDLLMESVCLPPPFGEDEAEQRSHWTEPCSERYYPPNVHAWEAFTGLVNNFVVPVALRGSKNVRNYCYEKNQLIDSMMQGKFRCYSKHDDTEFLIRAVWGKLKLFGCLKTHPPKSEFDEVENGREIIKVGRPDYCSVTVDGRLSVVIEVKASHNLLLPNDVATIQTHYAEVFEQQLATRSEERNKYWSQIGHPMAQILGYMIDNNCRYGALCSANKTYFLYIEGDNCRITRAWVTCGQHFLKAWMAFLLEAQNSQRAGDEIIPKPPSPWQTETPLNDSSQPGTGGGGQDDERNRKKRRRSPRGHKGSEGYNVSESVPLPTHFDRWETPSEIQRYLLDFELNLSVKFVLQCHLKFVDVLGEGRNGQVLKTVWNGTEVAVKQFDLSKRESFDAYKNEVEAYTFLRRAWGKHVPTPLFLSRSKSGQVAFLGMTLGKKITNEDIKNNGYWEKYIDQVSVLENDFGFCHLDIWEDPRVCNFIVDQNEKVLVIDLEAWEQKD